MNNIPLFKVFMTPEALEPLNKVLLSGNLTQGKQVEQFEMELQKYFQHPYILTLNSATSGLTLAQRLALSPEEWNKREEITVLTPPLTCFATTVSVMANNMKIGWIDTQEDNPNVSINSIKSKLTKNTRIIQVVHWGGYPVDLDALKELQEYCQKEYNHTPIVIEDCAHSFGAEYKNKKIGTHGNICVFSLQAIKHLTTGDGGLIFLPNEEMYKRAKLLRWYGIDRDHRNKGDFRLEHDITEWGYKYHMNDINATIGLCNLPHIEGLLQKNAQNAAYLKEKIKNPYVISFPALEKDSKSANWLFTIFVKDKDGFIQYLNSNNITCSQVHKRNDINSTVKQYACSLPNLDKIEKQFVCIPVGWWLTKDDLNHIVNTINMFRNQNIFMACNENC